VPHRLVEAHHVPADLPAGPITILIGALTAITSVPPRVTRLERQPPVGPRQIEVDRAAIEQHQRVLADRLGESGAPGEPGQQLLESGGRRARPHAGPLEPLLERGDTAAARAADTGEVGGGIRR
jgi:hypothetical protein